MPAMRIVVAEDDAAIRELLAHHLTREGFRCIETHDGPSTLRAVRAGADLVILDVGLPVVDGFEVMKTLRRESRAVPVLMLTACGPWRGAAEPFRIRGPSCCASGVWKWTKPLAKHVWTASMPRSNRASSRCSCNWQAIRV